MKGQKQVQWKEAQRVHSIVQQFCEDFKVAIDGGAHVGSWAVELAKYFDEVHAFEPCEESYRMLVDNTFSDSGITTYQVALLDKPCNVDVVQPRPKRTALTARFVKLNENGAVACIAIDQLNLTACDFIKLDLEGAECAALLGAKKTIKQFHPVLVIEFNNLFSRFGHTEGQLLRMLSKWGYEEIYRDGVDRGFKWIPNS